MIWFCLSSEDRTIRLRNSVKTPALAQKILEDSQRRAEYLLRLDFQCLIPLRPTRRGLITLPPKRFENAFGALDLLHRRSVRLTALRQVGNVADEKAADSFVGGNSLQQHDHGLLVRIPTLAKHLA